MSGFPNYIVAALKTIFLYFHAPLIRLEYDGQTEKLSALMVSIMNGRRMGGGFMMAPESSNLDGLLDLCIARQVSRGRIFALIPHFLKGDQATQKSISTARAKHVQSPLSKAALPVHADGETICIAGSQPDDRAATRPAQPDLPTCGEKRMTLAAWAVNTTIKSLTHVLCKINDEQLAKVPKHGPLILVANHINFLDIPIVFTHLQPRPVTGFIKSETWDNPVMAFLVQHLGRHPDPAW